MDEYEAFCEETGITIHYRNNKKHREDGPAVVNHDGSNQWWFYHGKLHRLGGPAVIQNGCKEWWYKGKPITKYLKKWASQRNIDIHNMSSEDQSAFIFEFLIGEK
jgi:hypothetical protein